MSKEINLPDYIEFVYNRFIMTRVEYLIFTQNEQAAKVLRVIEWCVENERARLYREAKGKAPQGRPIEIPEIVAVPISHRFILEQLHGTIQSETTLKNIIADLEAKRFIFKGERGIGPYDPAPYTINKHLMAQLTKLLPANLDGLDMVAIMRQERQTKKPIEGQKLTPSKIDPLVSKIRETINAPLDPQLLTLYQSIIDPLSRSTEGQKLTPKIYKKTKKEDKDDSSPTIPQVPTDPSANASSSLSISLSSSLSEEDQKHIAVETPQQPEEKTPEGEIAPVATSKLQATPTSGTEPLSPENELEERIASMSLNAKEKTLLASVPLPVKIVAIEWRLLAPGQRITETMIRHATTLVEKNIQSGELAECRKWLIERDNEGYFAQNGLWLGNIVNDFDLWRSARVIARPTTSPSLEPPRSMTEEERNDFSVWILTQHPELVIWNCQNAKGHYIAIAQHESEEFDLCIYNIQDWNEIGRERFECARAYGKAYWVAKERQEKKEKLVLVTHVAETLEVTVNA